MAPTPEPVHRIHAFTDDALGDLDAVGLAAEIGAGRVFAAEAVEAAIARIERVDPELAAVACPDFARARDRAAQPRAGVFSGVPTVVKDNVDVAGLPTQQGSAAFHGRPKVRDGDFAAAFGGLGAVVLGKSQLSEFGVSPSAESPGRAVRNPWDTRYTSGASSAGSAALVAAGAVPFAHGNDGGGSIRIPAAACGLVGLKPSRGRIPQEADYRKMPVRVVADGVLTRTVRDTAAYLQAMETLAPAPGLAPIGEVRGPGRAGLRIGVVTDSPAAVTDAPTRAAVEEAGRLMESLGHHVETVSPPVSATFVDSFKTYYGLLFLYLNATGRPALGPDFDWRATESLTRGFAGYTLRRLPLLPRAIMRLRAAARDSAAMFSRYHAVITPTVSHLTPRIGHLDPTLPFDEIMDRVIAWTGFTPLQNATGEPGMSLPWGLSTEGTPIGVHLTGPLGSERMLLELAFAVEQARPFADIRTAGV